MKFVYRAVTTAVLGVLLFNYVILPITTPQLKLRHDWSEAELQWAPDEVTWFLHVTDLHISKHIHLDIRDSLEEFFSTTLDTIRPSAVLASGDLTDAKDGDGVDSYQVLEEWDSYAALLRTHRVVNKTLFLDIRGNHDAFNVPHVEHPSNLHRIYSGRGPHNPASYSASLRYGNSSVISFVAIDATPKPGPKKVFNFLGQLTEDEVYELRQMREKLPQLHPGDDDFFHSVHHVVYFGHYPSSCIVAPQPGFRDLLQGGLVYLSGHLHTLGGLAPQLYSLHRNGIPELELGDWKENRRFRLLAVDNGILSFSDLIHGEWPAVVVTNPKHSGFLAPHVEPVQKMTRSTEIRVLAFSTSEVTSVMVQVDNGPWITCHASEAVQGLYIAPWAPELLEDATGGLPEHQLKVFVTDSSGRSRSLVQPFTIHMENLESRYSLSARIILMADVLSVLRCIWLLSVAVSLLPMYLGRACGQLLPLSANTAQSLEDLASFAPFYYVYVWSSLLVGFGPWHAGEFLTGHTGIMFPWTIYVAGTFLPSFYPHVFSLSHLLFFQTPLLWSLVFKFKWRVREETPSRMMLAVSNIPVTLVLSAQASLLLLLYYYPSRLGILREIAILIAPMELLTMGLGFAANALVSYHITETRKQWRRQ